MPPCCCAFARGGPRRHTGPRTEPPTRGLLKHLAANRSATGSFYVSLAANGFGLGGGLTWMPVVAETMASNIEPFDLPVRGGTVIDGTCFIEAHTHDNQARLSLTSLQSTGAAHE